MEGLCHFTREVRSDPQSNLRFLFNPILPSEVNMTPPTSFLDCYFLLEIEHYDFMTIPKSSCPTF